MFLASIVDVATCKRCPVLLYGCQLNTAPALLTESSELALNSFWWKRSQLNETGHTSLLFTWPCNGLNRRWNFNELYINYQHVDLYEQKVTTSSMTVNKGTIFGTRKNTRLQLDLLWPPFSSEALQKLIAKKFREGKGVNDRRDNKRVTTVGMKIYQRYGPSFSSWCLSSFVKYMCFQLIILMFCAFVLCSVKFDDDDDRLLSVHETAFL